MSIKYSSEWCFRNSVKAADEINALQKQVLGLREAYEAAIDLLDDAVDFDPYLQEKVDRLEKARQALQESNEDKPEPDHYCHICGEGLPEDDYVRHQIGFCSEKCADIHDEERADNEDKEKG